MHHIHGFLESNSELINKFGEDKFIERFESICAKGERFIKAMGFEGKVVLDRFIVAQILIDYFSDIGRVKDFHKIDLANSVKIAAYEASWLIRRKPIQVIDVQEPIIFVNEYFAFFRLLEYIQGGNSADNLDMPQDCNFFWDSLLYYLKYRNIDPQSLELALLAVEAGRKLQQQTY